MQGKRTTNINMMNSYLIFEVWFRLLRRGKWKNSGKKSCSSELWDPSDFFFYDNCPVILFGIKLILKCASAKSKVPLTCYLVFANQNSKGMYWCSRSGRERKAREIKTFDCASHGRFLYLIGKKEREFFSFYLAQRRRHWPIMEGNRFALF